MSKKQTKNEEKKRIGRPPKNKQTQVMRVAKSTYDKLKKLRQGRTYDEVFEEVFEARKLIQDAPKVFEIDGKLLRGFTLPQARQIAEAMGSGSLRVLLELGDDQT